MDTGPATSRRALSATVACVVTVMAAVGSACGGADDASSKALTAASTWQWQLQGELDTSADVDVYDIDVFDSEPSTIAGLQADGRTVICYFSAGSYESWRPDADEFDPTALGDTLDGFEDERWLDVREVSVRAVAEGRLDLAVDKGCDGIEPDNVCLLYTSPSPRDGLLSRMPSSA